MRGLDLRHFGPLGPREGSVHAGSKERPIRPWWPLESVFVENPHSGPRGGQQEAFEEPRPKRYVGSTLFTQPLIAIGGDQDLSFPHNSGASFSTAFAMRNRFPALWILQLIILLGTGLAEMIMPQTMLEGYLGVSAPVEVDWPDPELGNWALGLESVPAPPPDVVAFFSEHAVAYPEAGVWSSDDPGSVVLTPAKITRWQATIRWILSASPQLPGAEQQLVDDWLRAVDQSKIPRASLIEWVKSTEQATDPPAELLVWIQGMDQVNVETWTLAADSVRQESPYIIAAALFTFFGLINPMIRAALARIFTIIFVLWTVPIVYGHQPEVAGELLMSAVGDEHIDPKLLAQAEARGGETILQARHLLLWLGLLSGVTLALTFVRSVGRVTSLTLFAFLLAWCGGIVWFAPAMPPLGSVSLYGFLLLALINGFYWLVVKPEVPAQDDAGIAEGRPPQLWTLWFVQFVFLMSAGVAVMVFPNQVFEFFTVDSHDHLATTMVDDQLRFSGTWIIAMALFSYVSLGAADDRTWRALGYTFICSFAIFALGNLLNISSGEYSIWAYAFSLQGAVFIPFTYSLLRKSESRWFRENVERESDHPTLLGLWAVARMVPWLTGKRSVFRHGIGTSGTLTILPQVRDLPDHDFFVPGKRYSLHARFSNRAHGDDASLDFRGVGLKIYDRVGIPVLELPFLSGSFALVSNLWDFFKVIPRRAADGRTARSSRRIKKLVRTDRDIFEGYAAGLRRAPSSFAALTYHHQTTRHWITPDCEQWLCRLRLRPEEDVPSKDIGRPDAEDLKNLSAQKRRTDESRSNSYLREDLKARIDGGERPRFVLEVQLHRLAATDSLEWYDSSVEWRESEHPWQALGSIELRGTLTADEARGLRLNPSRAPLSLSIPKSRSPSDPRSLATAQARVMRLVGKARLWRRPVVKPPRAPHLSDPDPDLTEAVVSDERIPDVV